MISCEHQPNYIPWMGLFHKIARCNTLVIADDVAFSRQGYTARNWIESPNGRLLLSVPVRKGSSTLPINEVAIANEQRWKSKHMLAIQASYRRAPYFDLYWDGLKSIYDKEWEYIVDLNMAIIDYVLECLGVHVDKIMASELECEGHQTERILRICKTIGTKVYVAGQGARSYLDVEMMEENGVCVVFDKYSSPSYPQQWGEFVPNMSAIDAIFNLGPEARLLLDD